MRKTSTYIQLIFLKIFPIWPFGKKNNLQMLDRSRSKQKVRAPWVAHWVLHRIKQLYTKPRSQPTPREPRVPRGSLKRNKKIKYRHSCTHTRRHYVKLCTDATKLKERVPGQKPPNKKPRAPEPPVCFTIKQDTKFKYCPRTAANIPENICAIL